MPVNPSTDLSDSAALHSFGLKLFYAPWVAGMPDTFTQVVGGVEASMTGRSFTKVDIHHLLSTDFAKEYIAGFEDPGQVELKFRFNAALMAALQGLIPPVDRSAPSHGRKRWKLVDQNQNYVSLKGYLDPPNMTYPDDSTIEIAATIVVSGRPVFTKVET